MIVFISSQLAPNHTPSVSVGLYAESSLHKRNEWNLKASRVNVSVFCLHRVPTINIYNVSIRYCQQQPKSHDQIRFLLFDLFVIFALSLRSHFQPMRITVCLLWLHFFMIFSFVLAGGRNLGQLFLLFVIFSIRHLFADRKWIECKSNATQEQMRTAPFTIINIDDTNNSSENVNRKWFDENWKRFQTW